MFNKIVALFPNVRERYDKYENGWVKFVAALSSEIFMRKFSINQLVDAYKKLIETPTYNGQLEISSILNMDNIVKFYSYKEAKCGTDPSFAKTNIKFKKNREIAFVKVEDRAKAEEMFNNGINEI